MSSLGKVELTRARLVAVGLGAFRQNLVGDKGAVGTTPDDVGEGAAPIDPEIPLARNHHNPAEYTAYGNIPVTYRYIASNLSKGRPGGSPAGVVGASSMASQPHVAGPVVSSAHLASSGLPVRDMAPSTTQYVPS